MPSAYALDAALLGSFAPRDLQLSTRRSTLVGEFLFGLDLLQSRENSAFSGAVPGAELLAAGAAALVYGDHQVEVGNAAMIDTMVMAQAAQTILIACTVGLTDAASTTEGILLSTASAAAQPGRFTLLGSNQQMNAGLNGIGAGTVSLAPTAPFSMSRVFALRVSQLASGATVAFDEFMGGARTKGAKSTTTNDRPAQTASIAIGGAGHLGVGPYPLRSRVTAALVHNAYLSDADLLSEYTYLAAILAEMGKPA